MDFKYAIIFPGNLSSYFLCIENFKKILNHNIHIYILYSKDINYIHTFSHNNINIDITPEDIDIINSNFNKNIKYFKAI